MNEDLLYEYPTLLRKIDKERKDTYKDIVIFYQAKKKELVKTLQKEIDTQNFKIVLDEDNEKIEVYAIVDAQIFEDTNLTNKFLKQNKDNEKLIECLRSVRIYIMSNLDDIIEKNQKMRDLLK